MSDFGAHLARGGKPGVLGDCGHQELSLLSVLNVCKAVFSQCVV